MDLEVEIKFMNEGTFALDLSMYLSNILKVIYLTISNMALKCIFHKIK